MHKKAWIRIVEAFVAILLVAGVVLILINSSNVETNPSEDIKEIEISILQEIQTNNTLRQEILDTSGTVSWDSLTTEAPDTRTFIEDKIPGNLNCAAQICSVDDLCFLLETIEPDSNVYTESIRISSTLQSFSPRQLKIFCWES